MRVIDAPVARRGDRLTDILPEILRSKCRCAVVVSEDRVEGYITLMNVVRRLALEWLRGSPPHEALGRLEVGSIHVSTIPVLHGNPPAEHIITSMFMHGSDAALLAEGDAYRLVTILDAAYDLRRLLYGVTVGSLVESQVWWVASPTTTVKRAFMQLSMLPTWRLIIVAPDNSIVGIFSATDFLRMILEGARPYDEKLDDILPEATPLVADTDQAVVDALFLMRKQNVQIMPVVEGLEGFRGVITAHDIARLAAVRAMGGEE